MVSVNLSSSKILSQTSILSSLSQTDAVNAVASRQYQCDCACEGAIGLHQANSLLPAEKISPALEQIQPHAFSQIYTYEVNERLCLYNPNSSSGVMVLDGAATLVWNSIQKGYNLNLILQEIKKFDPHALFADLLNLVADFERHHLIYLTSEEPVLEISAPETLSVWLHISNQCNLRCTYCYLGKTNELMSLETGKRAIESLVESAGWQKMRKMTLKFSGGEALLEWPLVLQLYTYARELAEPKGIEIQPVILSNGTTITAAVAQRLKNHGFFVAVSLDGLGDSNNVQRPYVNGRGSFASVERGLLLLQEYDVPFNVSIVVTAHNLPGLPELFDYLLTRKMPFNLNFFRDNPLAAEGLSVDNPTLIEGMLKAYAKIEAKTPSFSLLNSILDRVQLESPHRHACGAGVNYVVIKHTGEISTCQMLLHKPVAKAGTRDPLRVIQNADLRNVPSDKKEGCSSCQWKYVCAGGCPLVTNQVFGRYDTSSPFCQSYKALIPEVLRLEAIRLLKLEGELVPATMS